MKRELALAVIVVAFCIAAYANTFGNDFVWDERVFIEGNTEIRSLSNIPSFFSQTEFGLYRPLRTTLYALNFALWGLNPVGYHLNSLLWHAASSVMVLLILTLLTKHNLIPVFAASIFAVHPVHTERVTNITGGFDLLGIFLLLLAFYFYILYSRGKKRMLLPSIAVFALALFASEEALTLPLLIVLYEGIFGKRIEKKRVKTLAAYFTLLASFVALRIFAIGAGARESAYPTGSFITTMLTMGKVFGYYLYLIFIPYPLTLYRLIETVVSPLNLLFITSLLVLGVVAAMAFRYRKKQPFLAFFAGWFFITLLPFSNILPLQSVMADRYLYLPSLAGAVVLSFAVFKISRQKVISLAVAIVIISSFMALTFDANRNWKDDLTLWEETSKTSQAGAVYSNLGFAYEREGRLVDAKIALSKAIAAEPDNAKAHHNLGVVFLKENNFKRAAEEFMAAISQDSEYVQAYDSLGVVYYRTALQRPDLAGVYLEQAEASLIKAIETDPGYYKAYADLGIVKAQQGNLAEAEALLQKSIELNPWNSEAYYNLGILKEFLGQKEEALENFAKAAKLEPGKKEYAEKYLQHN